VPDQSKPDPIRSTYWLLSEMLAREERKLREERKKEKANKKEDESNKSLISKVSLGNSNASGSQRSNIAISENTSSRATPLTTTITVTTTTNGGTTHTNSSSSPTSSTNTSPTSPTDPTSPLTNSNPTQTNTSNTQTDNNNNNINSSSNTNPDTSPSTNTNINISTNSTNSKANGNNYGVVIRPPDLVEVNRKDYGSLQSLSRPSTGPITTTDTTSTTSIATTSSSGDSQNNSNNINHSSSNSSSNTSSFRAPRYPQSASIRTETENGNHYGSQPTISPPTSTLYAALSSPVHLLSEMGGRIRAASQNSLGSKFGHGGGGGGGSYGGNGLKGKSNTSPHHTNTNMNMNDKDHHKRSSMTSNGRTNSMHNDTNANFLARRFSVPTHSHYLHNSSPNTSVTQSQGSGSTLQGTDPSISTSSLSKENNGSTSLTSSMTRRTSTSEKLKDMGGWFLNVSTTSSKSPPDIHAEISRVLTLHCVTFNTEQPMTFICEVDVNELMVTSSTGGAATVVDDQMLGGVVVAVGQATATLKAKGRNMVQFQIEIVKIPRLTIHGLHFKRLSGGVWNYKKVCNRLLSQMKL